MPDLQNNKDEIILLNEKEYQIGQYKFFYREIVNSCSVSPVYFKVDHLEIQDSLAHERMNLYFRRDNKKLFKTYHGKIFSHLMTTVEMHTDQQEYSVALVKTRCLDNSGSYHLQNFDKNGILTNEVFFDAYENENTDIPSSEPYYTPIDEQALMKTYKEIFEKLPDNQLNEKQLEVKETILGYLKHNIRDNSKPALKAKPNMQ